MPLEYGTDADQAINWDVIDDQTMAINYEAFNRQWDWVHDVDYVHELMTRHIPIKAFRDPGPWIFQADDWGAGIAMAYAGSRHAKFLRMMFLVNPIMLDGYFVIEIGTIGRLAEVFLRDRKTFGQFAAILPQTIVGIEKYMIKDRKRMNRYTESDYMFPYVDTNYQTDRLASEMKPCEWVRESCCAGFNF